MKQDDGVRLSQQDIERLQEYRWDMTGYSLKCPLVIYEKINGGLTCRETVIKKALDYQPGETSFLTYLYPFIRDAILTAAMQEEQWAFSSLTEYKRVRMMAAI